MGFRSWDLGFRVWGLGFRVGLFGEMQHEMPGSCARQRCVLATPPSGGRVQGLTGLGGLGGLGG